MSYNGNLIEEVDANKFWGAKIMSIILPYPFTHQKLEEVLSYLANINDKKLREKKAKEIRKWRKS